MAPVQPNKNRIGSLSRDVYRVDIQVVLASTVGPFGPNRNIYLYIYIYIFIAICPDLLR